MLKSINKVIKVLVISDFFLNYGWGLLSPVFALFLVERITGSVTEGAKVAGFAALFYWITKSVLQIPIGRYLDKNHGDKDDFLFLIIGMFMTGLVPFGYLISSQPWHIYLCQFWYAVGMAMVFPPWLAIFTRHIDKGREAFEWSLESTAIGLGAGIAGAIGGITVYFLGFGVVFVIVGSFTIVSSLLLLLIRKEMAAKSRGTHQLFPPRPF